MSKDKKIYAKLILSESNYISCTCGKCGASISAYTVTPSQKYCSNCGTRVVIPNIVARHIKELKDRYDTAFNKGKLESLDQKTKEEIKKNISKEQIKNYILEVINDQIGDDEYIDELVNDISDEAKSRVLLLSLKQRFFKK